MEKTGLEGQWGEDRRGNILKKMKLLCKITECNPTCKCTESLISNDFAKKEANIAHEQVKQCEPSAKFET